MEQRHHMHVPLVSVISAVWQLDGYLCHLSVFDMLHSSFNLLQSGFLLLQLLLNGLMAVKAMCSHLSELIAALDSLTADHT